MDPILDRLVPGFMWWRHRRTWNGLARTQTRGSTAAQDAEDWEVYWASGRRDLSILLEVGNRPGQLGTGLVVDLGCGIGRLARPLSEDFAQVVGADISSEMLAQARANVLGGHVHFILVGPECRLDLRDDSADVMIAWTLFRHTPKSVFESYLREARRVLKVGGRLLFEAQIRIVGEVVDPPEYEPVIEREYTRDELHGYCNRGGFGWAAEMVAPSITPGTSTLVMAWQK